MAKKKFYTVWVGKEPGVYTLWNECEAQVKGVDGAKFKSFKTREEAEQAYANDYRLYISVATSKKKTAEASLCPYDRLKDMSPAPEWDSISVDAACSGNPGVMEYRGVDTKTGEEIFRKKFERGTNNIGEFLAIVHALALFSEQNPKLPIYTDSRTAMSWVSQKKCKTTFSDPTMNQLIARAVTWLTTHRYANPIVKWDTKLWGEIPADFGRK